MWGYKPVIEGYVAYKRYCRVSRSLIYSVNYLLFKSLLSRKQINRKEYFYS